MHAKDTKPTAAEILSLFRGKDVSTEYNTENGKHYSIKDPERLRPSMQRITDRVLELAELN